MTILTIARTTFGEAIRKKVLMTFLGVTIALIPISLMFGFFSFRQEMTTIKSFCFGMIGIAGLLIALIMGIQLVPTEIERRTIYTILSKPVNRYEFLLGKFLGAVITLFISIGLMGLVVIAAITIKTYDDPISKGQYLYGIKCILLGAPKMFGQLSPGLVLIFFQLVMVLALAIFFSTFLGAWINFFATSGLYCVGSVSEITGSLVHDPTKPAITRAFGWLIHNIVPQFGNFHVLNPILNPNFLAKDLGKYVAEQVVYAMLVCVMLMAFGIWAFEKREV
jgi:ABC-type transport system involved in multi-copper enzyme maturation permease subunit